MGYFGLSIVFGRESNKNKKINVYVFAALNESLLMIVRKIQAET